MWSCQESNLDLEFRKLLFYPLNYRTNFLSKLLFHPCPNEFVQAGIELQGQFSSFERATKVREIKKRSFIKTKLCFFIIYLLKSNSLIKFFLFHSFFCASMAISTQKTLTSILYPKNNEVKNKLLDYCIGLIFFIAF